MATITSGQSGVASQRVARKSRRRARTGRLAIESLEERMLLAGTPDLELLTATAPAAARIGDTIQLTWTTKNSGGDAPVDWFDSVYVSDNATFEVGDQLIDTGYPNACTIAMNGSYSFSHTVTLRSHITPGNRFLLFRADAGSNLTESNENNNLFAMAINLSPTLVDLVPTTFAPPATVDVGQTLTLSWIATNQGTDVASARDWSDSIYLSDDGTLDSNDTLLTQHYRDNSAGVANGASYSEQTNVTIPNKGTGDKFLLLAVDKNDGQAESNESNNVVARPIRVNLPTTGLPDLVPSNITGVPATATAGDSLTVGFTVTNSGTATAQNDDRDQIFLSTDAVYNSGDQLLGSVFHYQPFPLAAGANYQASRTVTIPSTASGGAKYLLVVADQGDENAESNETNNVAAVPITITALGMDSDLVITTATAPATAIIGDKFDVMWTAKNQGTGVAAADWSDRAYISDEPRICGSYTSITLSTITSQTPLAAGATYSLSKNITVPATAPGNRYLVFEVDSTKNQPESNETNNLFALPISLSAPDLEVTTSGSPASAVIGDTVSFSWTVTNTGSVSALADWYDAIYISDDPAYSNNDTFVGSEFISTQTPLAGGANYVLTKNYRIPATAAGNRYVLFVADIYNYQGETLETNNVRAVPISLAAPDLTVLNSTSPASAVLGQQISLSWTVKNLGPAAAPADWYDIVYLSSDNKYDSSDTQVTSEYISTQSPLAVDGTYTINKTNVTLPSGAIGNVFLLFVADGYNYQGETDETNNTRAVPVTITAPDLVVTSSTSPATAVLGDTITLSWTVKNQSAVAAAADWYDAVYISDDASFDFNDTQITSEYISTQTPLAPDATYVVTKNVTLAAGGSGNKYLLFFADYDDSQGEIDETNNVRAVPITLSAPDLTIAVAPGGVPANIALGASFDVTWTVSNAGAVAASADWSDYIYVSDNTTLEFGSDTYVTSFFAGGSTPLAAGGQYTFTRNIELPGTATGNRYLLFVADGSEDQGETNESNNIVAVPVSITGPDLTPTNLTVPPGAALNKTISISWTVKNQGNAAAGGYWYDNIYLSNDPTYDFSDVYVDDFYQSDQSPLGPNATYTETQQITIPNTTTGDRYLLVFVNQYGNQAEWPNTNNVIAIPITLVAADVDLVPTASTSPATGVLGDTIPLSWTVQNQGTDIAPADWNDYVYISDDTSYDPAQDTFVTSRSISAQTPLAAGASYTITGNATLPQTGLGNRYLLFIADATNQQGERTESNNVRAVPITLSAPDLTIAVGESPSVAVINRTYPVSWTVTNSGSVPAPADWFDAIYLSTDTTYSPGFGEGGGDQFVDSRSISTETPLAPGASYTITRNITIPNGETGDLYLLFLADFTAHQGETDETNNVAAVPIRVSPPTADLIVTALTAPSTVTLGDSIAISWTVANQGDLEAAADWLDGVYISNDDVLDGSDVRITSESIVAQSPLAAGTNYVISRNVVLSSTEVGAKYLIIKADADNQQGETTDSNNTRATPITLVAPDLIVSTSTSPATGTVGDSIEISFRVTNSSDQPAPADWHDAVYISSDNVLDASDVFLGSQFADSHTPLAAGASYMVSMNVTLAGSPGNRFLLFVADSSRNQPETNEANNVRAAAITLIGPDLTVTNGTAPASATSAETVPVTWTVRNHGNVVAPADWFDGVYFSDNPTFSPNDVLAASFSARDHSPLAAGAEYTMNHDIIVPPLSSGLWYVLFVADRTGLQGESDESNNVFAVAITITNPDLQITNPAAPAAASIGESITVSWTVNNIGSIAAPADWFDGVYLSDDTTLSGNDTLVGSIFVADRTPLAAGGSYSISQSFRIPNTGIGDRFLLIRTDDSFSQGETNETNNVTALPVTVHSVDLGFDSTSAPATGQFGQSVAVSWTVRNSGNGTTGRSWIDQVFFSTNNVLDRNDLLLLSKSATDVAPLGAGSTYTRNETPRLPLNATLTAGTYYLFVVTDSIGEQIETGDVNNVSAPLPIELTFPPLPDLVVSNIVAPASGFTDQRFLVTWTDRNAGNAIATGPWLDRVYISADEQFDVGDELVGEFLFSDTIASNSSIERTQPITFPSVPGNYWIIVVTDARTEVAEGPGDLNNTTIDAEPINVIQSPLPDLVVTSVTPPPNGIFAGSTTQISFVVENRGDAPTSAPAWSDFIFISQDPTFTFGGSMCPTCPEGDQVINNQATLTHFQNPGYLEPGQSYVQTVSFTLPDDALGSWYVYAIADGLGFHHRPAVQELDNSNNLGRSAAFTIALGPIADLEVTSVMAPPQAFSGQSANLNWTVTNTGDARTKQGQWFDRVYMSTDLIVDAADHLLAQIPHSGVLEPGGEYSVSTTVQLPVGVSGDFFFLVETDATARLFEGVGETNNVGADTPATRVNLTPPPDLEVTSVDGPSVGSASRAITFRYTVANRGAGRTPNAGWTDTFYLSSDTTLDVTDIPLGRLLHLGMLDPDEEYSDTTSVRLPNGLSGTFYLFVLTDFHGEVFENGERSNNAGFDPTPIVIESRPADLVVSAVTAPAAADAGKSIIVTWTVTNRGTGDTAVETWTDRLFASVDGGVGNDDDVRLGQFVHHGLLAAGESYSRTETVTLPIAFQGTYQLFVVTDVEVGFFQGAPPTGPGGAVFEGVREDNNVSSLLVITVARRVADLQVTAVSATGPVTTGQPLEIAWTTKNAGSGRTNTNFWYDDVYLSRDASYSADDVYLGSAFHTGALDAGQQYDVNATFSIPATLATGGAYFLLVRADRPVAVRDFDTDVNRVFEEPLDGNNDRATASPIQVNLAPAADLVFESIDAPATATAGRSFQLNYTVRNDGTAPAPSGWVDAFYLSPDQVFDRFNDHFLGSTSRFGSLEAGATLARSVSVSVPPGIAGSFYVFVVLDANRQVFERAGESNNVGYDPALIEIALPAPVDLVIGMITVPGSSYVGQVATVTYTVHNAAETPATGGWHDALYLSADTTLDRTDPLIGRVLHTGDLAGGASYTESLTAPLPAVRPGDYFVIVRSDVRNRIVETNEANNIGASLDDFLVDVPELTLGVPVDGTLGDGEAVYYRVDVQRGETLAVRLDGQGVDATNELFVRFGDLPTRGQFDFRVAELFSADQEVIVPFTRAGTYYVMAFGADVPTTTGYSIVAELIPFSVRSIAPRTAGNVGPITLAIRGARFDRNTAFELVGPTGSRISSTNLFVQDPSNVYATFDLTGQPLGAYDIEAAGSGGQQTQLAGGLSVVAGVGPEFESSVTGPDFLLQFRPANLSVNYANAGDSDMFAPLVLLESASGAAIGLAPDATDPSGSTQMLGISLDGPAGILRPGTSFNLPIFVASATPPFTEVAARILTADSTEPIDWLAVEREVRSDAVPDSIWNEVWPKVRARIGDTWGGYVRELAKMATLFSARGERVYDPAVLFNQIYYQEAGFNESLVNGRILLDSTGEPVANVRVYARWIDPNATSAVDPNNPGYLAPYSALESPFIASGVTNANGEFSISSLRFGNYELFVSDYDAVQPVRFAVDRYTDALGVEVRVVQEPGAVVVPPTPDVPIPAADLEPSLAVDSAGRTHVVWQRKAQLWHAVAEPGVSGWTHAAPIPFAFGIKHTIQIGPNLLEAGEEGILVSWITGTGNEAEIYYTVGRLSADGLTYEWTSPIQLTNNTVNDDAYSVVVLPSGSPLFVWNKVDATLGEDDTDLYWETAAVPRNTTMVITVERIDEPFSDNAGTDAEARDAGEIRLRLGVRLEANIPTDTPVVGGKWEFTIRGTAKGEVTCSEAKGQAEIDIILKHRAGNVYGGGDHEWTAQGAVRGRLKREPTNDQGQQTECESPNLGDYKPEDATLRGTIGANAQYDLIDILTKIKPAGPILATVKVLAILAQEFGVSAGIRLELRTNFDFTWDPSDKGWQRPPDHFTWSTGGSIGGFVRWKTVMPFVGEEIELTGRVQWQQSELFQFKDGRLELASNPGDVCVFGRFQGSNTKPGPFQNPFLGAPVKTPPTPGLKRKGIYTDYRKCWPIGGGARSAPRSDLSPVFDGFDEFAFSSGDVAAGSANVYLDADGSDQLIPIQDPDMFDQGTPSLVRAPDGSIYMAVADGYGVNLYRYDPAAAAWDVIGWLPGTTETNNSGVQLAIDGAGRLIAVWSTAAFDSAGISQTSTSQEIWNTIKLGGDLVFAVYDPAANLVTSAGRIAEMPGPESRLKLHSDASGRVTAAWVHMDPDAQDSSIYAAIWNSATAEWGAADQIHTGAVVGSIAVASLGGAPTVMWAELFNITPATQDLPLNYDLQYSSFANGSWSSPVVFSFDSLDRSANEQRAVPRNDGNDWIDYSFEPPEDCDKDKPECDCKKNKDKNKPKKPPKPPGKPDGGYNGPTGGPKDPNEMIGPASFGDAHFIATAQPLDYMILFENAPEATAPAQEVIISTLLDPDLDFRTFRLGEFGWGNFRFQVPANSAFYQDRLDLREALGFYVDVFATIDVKTGLATWTFTTIDPQTGEKPLDGRIGFLPPNVADDAGQGFVSYRVRAKRTVRTGDVIDGIATIVFDTEPPLDTPPIFNTVDNGVPTSHVTTIATGAAARQAGSAGGANDILVQWAGSDDPGGSAIRDFDIFVSDNGGPFTLWLDNTTLTEAVYIGVAGHSYAFYSTARDNVGNSERTPLAADTTTSEIRGILFSDPNGNGVPDAGETGLAGRTMFIDSNGNGMKDPDEPSATTSSGGHYVFAGLVPGTYTLMEMNPPGGVRTAPAPGAYSVTIDAGGQVATGHHFAYDGRGPSISNLAFTGTRGIASIVLAVSEGLDPDTAAHAENYVLSRVGKSNKPVSLRSVEYDPVARTVTITPAKAIKPGSFLKITVGGAGTLTDLAGNRFDANGDGTPDDNFVTTIGRGSRLSYIDSDGDKVSLSVTGGTMTLTLGANREGLDLQLTGTPTVAGLTGTIKAPKKNRSPDSGKTTLRSITGLGDAPSNVVPPQFIVQNVAAQVVDALFDQDALRGSIRFDDFARRDPAADELASQK